MSFSSTGSNLYHTLIIPYKIWHIAIKKSLISTLNNGAFVLTYNLGAYWLWEEDIVLSKQIKDYMWCNDILLPCT